MNLSNQYDSTIVSPRVAPARKGEVVASSVALAKPLPEPEAEDVDDLTWLGDQLGQLKWWVYELIDSNWNWFDWLVLLVYEL